MNDLIPYTSPCAAVFPKELPYDEWFKAGKQVAALQNASLFWLGDWITFGREHFGGKYKHALEQLPNYRYQSLVNIAYVCARVPASLRQESLHFTHHTEVASMEEKEQKRWLTLAVKEQLSTVEMRRRIRGNAPYACDRGEPSLFNIVRWSREGIRWFHSHAAEIANDPQRKAALKQDLKPIADLYNAL